MTGLIWLAVAVILGADAGLCLARRERTAAVVLGGAALTAVWWAVV